LRKPQRIYLGSQNKVLRLKSRQNNLVLSRIILVRLLNKGIGGSHFYKMGCVLLSMYCLLERQKEFEAARSYCEVLQLINND